MTSWPGNLVSQDQTPLLQPPQSQFIQRPVYGHSVDQTVQVCVLDAQFDEPPLGRVEILSHERICMLASL
jgi:hypothetical protein